MAFLQSSPRTPLDMLSLFGGFGGDEPSDGLGPEKRFEFDLRAATPGASMLRAEVSRWRSVAKSWGSSIKTSSFTSDVSRVMFCDDSSILVLPLRVVITASGHLPLYKALGAILELIQSMNVEVEWMSFLRKNYKPPWGKEETTLAVEYASLKNTFPSGKPFIFGPLDNDHYFTFVYHDVHHSAGNPTENLEDDIQMNVAMYNIDRNTPLETENLFPHIHAASPYAIHDHSSTAYGYQTIKTTSAGAYEIVRVNTEASHLTSFASYETNHECEHYQDVLTHLMKRFTPDRITVSLTLDPLSKTAARVASGVSIGLEPEHFSNYELVNRTFTTLSGGYLVIKNNFARCR